MLRTKLKKVPIYDKLVMLVECDNIKELKTIFEGSKFDFDKTYKEDSDIHAHTISGTIKHKGTEGWHCIYLVLNRNHEDKDIKITFGTIAHECMHIMHFLYDSKSMAFETVLTQEHDAYLMGYLVNMVCKFLDIKPGLANDLKEIKCKKIKKIKP